MPQTIRKVLISAFGDASNVSVVSAEIPDPQPEEVQVRTIYSGFSGSDINMRNGTYPFQKKAPLTPGYCLVGTVTTPGKKATKFHAGDVVACLSIYDAEAELANLPEKYLIKVPSGIDLQQATALILDWNTAYGLVMHSAQVQPGQKVFVHGLSGAVGYAVMALSQWQGAHVYGTASERNHEALRKMGATPFTYTDKTWIDEMHHVGGADAVFDALGFESWDESYSILSTNGILVGYGGNLNSLNGKAPRSMAIATTKLLAKNLRFCGRRTSFYYIGRDQKTFVPDLNKLFELCAQGKIEPRIKTVYKLEDIQEAHRAWGKGEGMGSMVVKVGDE